MGGRIPEEIVEQIRAHFDILDVVQRYVHLKKSGRNYLGLCPFHSEKTPSFSVSPEKQLYYCFGCGTGGDTIKFIMEIEQMTFAEAVRHLADQAGIQVPESEPSFSDQKEDERQQMRNALDLAAKLYHYVLTSTEFGKRARRYVQERRILPETVKEFQIGYAPDSYEFLLSFMKKRGFDEELLEKAGLIASRETGSKRYFDRFRDRVMFPIHDSQGRVIGFGGRLIGDMGPKYLNSPETSLFHKGHHLFNLHRARSPIRKEQQAILFEGTIDVIAAWQAGIQTVIATLGTALTEEQARLIKRNTDTVIICYDADQAGQSAALKALDLLKNQGCTVKVAQMPAGLDPDDYIRRYGGEAFKEEILAGALPYTSFKLESLKKVYNLQDEDQRMKYLTEAIDVITDLPLAIEQDHYLRRLAEEFRLSLDALKEEQRKWKIRKKREAKRDQEQVKRNHGNLESDKQMSRRSGPYSVAEKSEMMLVAHMMRDQAITKWVKNVLGADFHTEVYAALAAYLYAYYDQGNPADAGRFISTLPDPSLVAKASELAMIEVPDEISEKALKEYVRHIRNFAVLKEIEEKEKLVRKLSVQDPVKAAQLSAEILQLKRKVHVRKRNSRKKGFLYCLMRMVL
ncbi:DNA primase [Lihuaxuella thermophila]|uniref:DNA primase n=1 Tax=Lihuaxuella thermophila TaxID=1173111 RepID=A0A1H8EHV6_9BACL|nr:DNA primase [Lihuaxuella thermophila]SEN19079.1 DNA primase [Lihuaxuella thermophila]